MSNTDKDTTTELEVLNAIKAAGIPTPQVPKQPSKKEEVTNTLNYVNAAHALLDNGLFSGKDSNVLIQVKAWLENQQKFLQLELAKAITSEAAQAGK